MRDTSLVDTVLLFAIYLPLLVAFAVWAALSLCVADPLVPQHDEHEAAPAARAP
ncbi:MAG: hypothetical protein JO023_18735 [Chloroflexi bacterium]|nr:hypothetical protein [Chloroflexota bacterium]